MATLLDWGNVESACKRLSSSLQLKDNREAFSLLCLSEILRIDFDEARGALTDGPDDRGIDGVYLEERSGQKVIHLFQFKYHSAFSRDGRNFPSTEIDKITSFIGDCFGQADGFLGTCNSLLGQRVLDIWDFIRAGSARVKIHLCSNGSKLLDKHLVRLDQALEKYKFFTVIEHDLDSISDALAHRTNSDRRLELKLVEEQIFERTDGNVRAVIGTVRADEFIASFVDPTDPLRLDPALFEENVRIFLGEENSVNKRIYDTALSDESELFWYYNNGITIVCEGFSYQPGFRNSTMELQNPQIVNGGQTSHALFAASQVDMGAIRNVRILLRVIETKDSSLYARVAEATNSQTPIRSRDLRSNDPILLKLESSLQSHGWYFDRKRDQYADQPESIRIDALKLGQFWLAFVRSEPDKAKTASDKIFGEFFPLVFDPEEMDAERIIQVWTLYSYIEGKRRLALDQSKASVSSRASSLAETIWVIEGLYHLAYMVRRLAERRGIDPFDSAKLIPLVEEANDKIGTYVKKRPGVSFYRLFRTARTKDSLFREVFEHEQMQLDL